MTKAKPLAPLRAGPSLQGPRLRDRQRTASELRLVLTRLQARSLPVSIAAVAKEAGVSAPLIHNKYPEIAEEIRALAGKTVRQRASDEREDWVALRAKNRALRLELNEVRRELIDLASENESLRRDLQFQLAVAANKVVPMHPKRDRKSDA